MTDLFKFWFWPAGQIGRGSWWLGQIGYFLFVVTLSMIFALTLGAKYHLENVPAQDRWMKASPVEKGRIMVDLNKEVFGPGFPTGLVVFTILVWSSICLECKRWHDLGLSGFWVLLRFIPAAIYALSPFIIGCASLVIGLVTLVIIGLLGGTYVEIPPSRIHNSTPALQTASPSAIACLGLLGIVVIGLLALECAALAGIEPASDFVRGGDEGFLAAVAKKQPQPVVADATIYRGTADTDFDKDWVFVAGQKVTGITNVQAAAGAQVTIVSSAGGKTVAASTLPQGFLYDWDLTPDRLKAMDAQ